KTAHQYNYIYWIFLKLLIETGMREGEAAALQWTDIDLKNQTINIDKTLDFTAKQNEDPFGDTKTLRSTRTIRIGQTLINNLRFQLS
ncbi:MAG: integrase, partial [Paenibacillus sp.]|nr:integrase [Paenibacillus sp.]